MGISDVPSVLVVEDRGVADSLREAGGHGFAVETAADSLEAIEILSERPFAVVIARSRAHDVVGVELAEQAAVHGGNVSVLLLTTPGDAPSVSRNLNGRFGDFLAEPFTKAELLDRVEEALRRQSRGTAAQDSEPETVGALTHLARRFRSLSNSMADSLSAALSLTHKPTHAHCERVGLRAASLASALEFRDEDVRAVYLAGLLHDLGKVTVSVAVLDKAGPLDMDEMAQVRSHPETAERIVSSVALPALTLAAIRHHHEWFDGTGYPDGLAGDAIPLGARIISVCDAYDAMVTDRPYKAAVSPEDAIGRLIAASVAQFDPAVVDAFVRLPEAQEV